MAALVLAVTPRAVAQHAPETTTTTTSSTSTSTTTTTRPRETTSTTGEPATTTTTAPEPAREEITSSHTTTEPGEAVVLGGGPGDPVASDGDQVTVNLAPANSTLSIQPAVRLVTAPDGTVTGVEITVPDDTPQGLYFIEVVVTRPNGTSRVLIAPLVVRVALAPSATVSAAALAQRGHAGVSFWVDEPLGEASPAVRAVQADLSTEDEAAVIAAVVEDGASLTVVDGELLVNTTQVDPADDSNRPLTAAMAVALAAMGLVAFRRRSTLAKGTR